MARTSFADFSKLKGAQLECITWIDSVRCDDWEEPHDMTKHMTILSIGWVTAETEEAVIITTHVQLARDHHLGDIAIPKVAIQRRIKYRP